MHNIIILCKSIVDLPCNLLLIVLVNNCLTVSIIQVPIPMHNIVVANHGPTN